MIWFNPRHPALLARGIHLADEPRVANTVRQRTTCLRELAAFGADQHLPELVSRWTTEDFHRFLAHHSNPDPEPRLVDHIVVIKALHRFGRALADGGLEEDPWPGMSAVAVLKLPVNGPLKTPVVKPETWFPLVRAAWTYITVFAPDILRALDRWQAIEARVEDIKLPRKRTAGSPPGSPTRRAVSRPDRPGPRPDGKARSTGTCWPGWSDSTQTAGTCSPPLAAPAAHAGPPSNGSSRPAASSTGCCPNCWRSTAPTEAADPGTSSPNGSPGTPSWRSRPSQAAIRKPCSPART
ncbi:hypothetical protein [Streptomyces sp. NBC_01443]|uniref:hypothetical protein n=1 Tax=Streptomyces sp. NBC_01443 TaxID=2903868 RepID=UPI0022544B8F|nr:hypothetical protein [Streptomyces sp. NBC_01443]MCX4625490.1 hypothetical protein [Streptomyces sp. NBC_01443]